MIETWQRSVRRIVGIALGLALAACVDAPKDNQALSVDNPVVRDSDDGLVAATLSLRSGELARGLNSFAIELRSPGSEAGAEIPALVSAVATMPAHGHSVSATDIVADSDSYRIDNLDLFMSGLWRIDLGVVLAERSEHVVFNLDVP